MPIKAITNKLAAIVGEQNITSVDSQAADGKSKKIITARPADWPQVRALVLLGREKGLNLIPRSSGAPHFRGSAGNGRDSVVIDLSGMKQILRLNRRNRVAYVEPGVTYGELIQKADEQGLKVLMPLLPRATKSVIASGLEREPITIPKFHWDMTDPLLCTELVLGTGELYRTGTAGSPGSIEEHIKAKIAHKNPMGPGQSDFLRIVQGAQGTLAIATWATVKLEVKPAIHQLHFVPEKDFKKVSGFTYRALRPKLGDEFFILNAYALASILADTPDQIPALAAKQAPYTIVYGVSGYAIFPEDRVTFQEHDLAAIAKSTGVSIKQEIPGATAEKMAGIIAKPSAEPYYKQKLKGAFKDIFFITTLDRAAEFIDTMHRSAGDHNYPADEIGLYIQPILHGRAAHVEFSLYYDPSDKKDTARADALFKDASVNLHNAGAFFSRPYGMWADLAYSRCPDNVKVLKEVKNMLDPDGILNQGSLCF